MYLPCRQFPAFTTGINRLDNTCPNPVTCRADKDSYPRDGRADKGRYWHDSRADKNPYRHDRRTDLSLLRYTKLLNTVKTYSESCLKFRAVPVAITHWEYVAVSLDSVSRDTATYL